MGGYDKRPEIKDTSVFSAKEHPDIRRRIGAAEENVLGSIIEGAHADVEQQNITIVQAERIDAGEDGVIGKTCALAVDGQVGVSSGPNDNSLLLSGAGIGYGFKQQDAL